MDMNTSPEEEKLYKEARKKVRRKKSYYSAIISYFAVGTFLTFLNWYTQRDEDTIHWWVIWVWFGWGIGMFFYTISFFKNGVVFGQDWEERKIKEEMEKMKRS
jgi:uncharacterized protein (DUF486 family)